MKKEKIMTKKNTEQNISKAPKLNDKELIKWTKILGSREIINLYVESKIHLTNDQLNRVINIKNNIDRRSGAIVDEYI